MLTTLASLLNATTAFVDEDRGLIWVADGAGSIKQVALGGGEVTVQSLPSAASGIAGAGGTLAVAQADGSVSLLDPADPGAPPRLLVRAPVGYGQVALSAAAAPTAAVVTSARPALPLPGRPSTSLTLVRTADGGTSSVAIAGLTGVAIDRRSTYVAHNAGTPLRGEVGLLRGSQVRSLAAGLPRVGRLGLADNGRLILVTHPGADRLSAIRPATGNVETVSTSAAGGEVLEAHGLSDGRIIILTAQALLLAVSLADLSSDPRITPVGGPVFVGSWVELGFDLGTSGLTKDQVRFEVPDGLDAGFVSYAQPNGVGDPVPLLVAGGKTGPHELRLVEISTASILATAEFEISDHWPDSEVGPGGFYTTNDNFEGGGGWGGGPGTPQNIGTQPHSGTWRSLVLMVDTSSRRWPGDAPTMTANRTAILGHVTNGILFNGDTRSARRYYEENSRFVAASGGNPARGLTLGVLNNQTFGPVALPDAWEDYFAQTLDEDGNVIDEKWWSKGATTQTIISRAISDGVCTTANFTNLDVLIIVPFSADAAAGAGARFVWPHANGSTEYLCGTNAMTDRRSFGRAFVPLDFDVHDGRQMHTTLSHELGHTLGLPDLYDFPEYSDDVSNRTTGDWDMMAGSRNALPHYSLSNKMRMGWIPAGHLKLYNFQGSSAVAQNITLHAAELGDPPSGRVKGIEIRLGDGWNYYVEYRAEQAAQVTDGLPTDRRVLITDVTSDTYTAPIARPPILLVHKDIDGDGPIIGSGADFEEKDPGTQMDLKVEVVSTAADNAVVKVSYGSNGKPEPGIRPWPGAPNWQSPDIEIRNDKATADPDKYFNTPWLGHDNKVVAKVRNAGDLLAKGVVVDFFVTEYSSGDGPWVSLGFDTQDVAANATKEFSTGWNPGAGEDKHYCVIVRIRLYQDPANLAIVDQNIYNNEARSNYTRFVSASASPSSRVGAQVLLANPFDKSTLVFADVKKSHPQHRVFTDHQWLRVPAKGQRPIQVWDEAIFGTPEWPLVAETRERRVPTRLWETPNRLSITGYAARPFKADCRSLTLTGGVGMRVDAGRATTIRMRAATPRYVAGEVSFVDNGGPVTAGGKVLIEMRDAGGRYFTFTDQVDPNGTFSIREFPNRFGDATRTIEVHYLGTFGAAPCTTGRISL
jgi:M6 family metalloprotease-like protein